MPAGIISGNFPWWYYFVVITSLPPPPTTTTGSLSKHFLICIVVAEVYFKQSNYSVREDGNAVNVKVILHGNLSIPVSAR